MAEPSFDIYAGVPDLFDAAPNPPRLVPTAAINVLEQTRPGVNPIQNELTKSVGIYGVNSAIDVCMLSPKDLKDYLAFIHEAWGSERTMDDCLPLPAVPGYETAPLGYIALIAGHSRLEAQLAVDRQRGVPRYDSKIPSTFRPETDVYHFVGRQVAENIHSAPPADRVARVHAESYLLELERNSGLTKTQYADDRGITTERLRNALFFTDVPKEIRDFVTAGELPFTVAVELGRALPVIREDVVSKYVDEYGVGTEWDTVTYELCLRTVTEELIRYASVFNTNRSVKGVIALIRLETKHKMDTLHPSGEPNFGGIDDDFFRNPTAGKTRRAQLIAAITSNLQSVVSSRGLQQRALHRDIRKLAEIEDEGTDLDTEAEDATAQLGQSVLLATKAS